MHTTIIAVVNYIVLRVNGEFQDATGNCVVVLVVFRGSEIGDDKHRNYRDSTKQ